MAMLKTCKTFKMCPPEHCCWKECFSLIFWIIYMDLSDFLLGLPPMSEPSSATTLPVVLVSPKSAAAPNLCNSSSLTPCLRAKSSSAYRIPIETQANQLNNLSFYPKRSGGSFLKALQVCDTTTRIGMMFLIYLAIGEPPSTWASISKHHVSCFRNF